MDGGKTQRRKTALHARLRIGYEQASERASGRERTLKTKAVEQESTIVGSGSC